MLYLLDMLNNVLKYVFCFLICVPIFFFGAFLFVRLKGVSKDIDDEIKANKESKRLFKKELDDFDAYYRSKHPGKID